jgi:hypothetical protein
MTFKTLILTTFFFLPLCSIGQNDSITYYKKSLDFNVFDQYSIKTGAFIIPSLSYSINRHSITLGPRISYANYLDEPNFGASVSYKIFPNLRDNKFNFYFSFNTDYLQLFRSKVIDSITIYNTTYHPKNVIYLEHTVGYGFQFAFNKVFYIGFETTAGIINKWETYSDKVSDKSTEPTVILQLSIGYREFNPFH